MIIGNKAYRAWTAVEKSIPDNCGREVHEGYCTCPLPCWVCNGYTMAIVAAIDATAHKLATVYGDFLDKFTVLMSSFIIPLSMHAWVGRIPHIKPCSSSMWFEAVLFYRPDALPDT
jgi:hypothetical protein